ILWTPIMWLRTSLEIRYRLHEIRRDGFATIDGTKIDTRFVETLEDPTDDQIKTWIRPKRKHVMVYAEDDKVVPVRLVKESAQLIHDAGGDVEMIPAPGDHPHPSTDISPQLTKIVEVLKSLG